MTCPWKQTLNLKCLILLLCGSVSAVFAGGTPDPGTGNSRDNQLFGSFNNTNGPAGGDFVNSTGGLNSNWLFNIEIPPGQTNLTVEIFDADVRGKFAAGEIHDTADANDANGAQATYRLINPLGVQVATATIGQNTAFDNTWAILNSNFSVTNPIQGHWQLEYDLVSATNAQGNTYGVRAHDGTSGVGGTEYNMYSPTYVPLGHGEDTDATNPGNEDQNYYPYVTRGCFIDVNDFDLDFDGSYTLTSPTADNFNSPVASSLSGNGLWNQENFTGWASADTADDYGLWDLFFDGINTNGIAGSVGQNLGAMYIGDETTTNPTPTTNPIANAFRIYLPADGSAYANGSGTVIDPTLPYLTQSYSQSCNTVTVTIEIVNPARANGSTPLPIEFDTSTAATNVITINVPTNGGATSVESGTENPSQGTALVSGNTVTWVPGVVAGATTQTLSFDVLLDRSFGVGPFTVVNSTQATFIDQTCAGSTCAGIQLQGATVQFGPLCPLSASACDLVALEGTVYNDINADASLNASDFGLPIITVNLLDGVGNPALDGMGNPITTMTATDGSYSFTDLPAGTYGVSVDTSTLPMGSNVADPTQTQDPDEVGVCAACDSLTTVLITIPIGQTASNIDFGYTGDSLPITLSSISSVVIDQKVSVNWSTSSELLNIGFQLWGLDGKDSKWEKLHGWVVPSGSGNSIEPQNYSKTVSVPRSINELVALGISSVDNDGTEHYYGPFTVGQRYGNLSTLKPIAWNHIRAQTDAQMAARGYLKHRQYGYINVDSATAASASPANSTSVIEFNVRESGVYRITAPQLQAAGIDWTAVNRNDIALIDANGTAVVRHVIAKGTDRGKSKTLGSRGEIYFHAQGVDNASGLYTPTKVYRLALDSHQALAAQYQGKRGISGGYSEAYQAVSALEIDRQYSLTSAGDDPWLDAVVVSYPDKTGSYATALPVEADALWDRDSVLTLGLARSSALTAVAETQDAEHHVEGVVFSPNGPGGLLPIGHAQATGAGEWTSAFTIPGGTPLTLINGKMVVGGVFSAGVGYRLSEVHVDSARVAYSRPYVAKAGDDHLAFTAPDDGASGYEVTLPETGWPVIFAHADGNLVRLAPESQSRQTDATGERQRVVRFAALEGTSTGSTPAQYWVSGKGGTLRVEHLHSKTIVSASSLLTQAAGADLLMIAHPVFMGASLSDYAAFKQSQGYPTTIINYLDVVAAFGGGQPGPMGLTNYLRALESRGDVQHVLLVGGSSYDHTDKLGTGAMTFIPGHYGASSYSSYTVSDTPYVTGADDGLFASIGRWPVRSAADLSAIIASSKAWSTRDHQSGSALVIAENTVAGENIDFAAALAGVASHLPGDWSTTEVSVDAIMASEPTLSLAQAISQAKGEIVLGLEAGPDVVLYNGHGTTSQLSNKGLFKAGDIATIDSSGAQLWVPMSCYMTYYESTHTNTLAHQLLFSGAAVGITGAMLLSNQGENIAAGSAVLNDAVNNAGTVGDAMTTHKRSQKNPSLNINWSMLGDPTLRM